MACDVCHGCIDHDFCNEFAIRWEHSLWSSANIHIWLVVCDVRDDAKWLMSDGRTANYLFRCLYFPREFQEALRYAILVSST
jgi:hypothetical protein